MSRLSKHLQILCWILLCESQVGPASRSAGIVKPWTLPRTPHHPSSLCTSSEGCAKNIPSLEDGSLQA